MQGLSGTCAPRARLAAAALALAGALAALPPTLAGSPAAAGVLGGQPNVLVVLVDDQPYVEAGFMPFLSARTDFIPLREMHTNNPLCCPARATLLSGEYSHHTGVENNRTASVADFDDSSTLATWFDDAGYETGLFGKYLNHYPFERGAGYVPPGWDSWASFLPPSKPKPRDLNYYDYRLSVDGTARGFGDRPRHYSTDVLRRKTIHFVEDAEAPFLAVFSPWAPHSPFTPAPRDRGSFSGAPVELPPNFNRRVSDSVPFWRTLPRVDSATERRRARGRRAASLAVDLAIERLFEALAAEDELDETVVLYLSDNGYSMGSHRFVAKPCPYEECAHVPALLRWPGEPSLVNEVDTPVSNVDVAPTLAAIAGVTPGAEVDGESLVPLLRGEQASLQRPVLMRFRRQKESWPPSFWGVRTERWKYIEYPGSDDRELYDLDADPFELTNLASDPGHADVVAARRDELDTLRNQP